MSTATEIMLRAQEMRLRMEPTRREMERWTDEMLLRWLAIGMWRQHLHLAADATRFQLTYTPGP